MMVSAYILFTIMIMFFNATPEIGYDRQVVPVIDQRHKDFCFDTKNMFIDSCIINDTVIFRQEGHFEGVQLSKYRCKYKLMYMTGFNMSIYCPIEQKCYIDISGRYNIGKCK